MAEDGVSLDAQRARVTAHAQAKGLELVDVVVDAGLSAKTLEREGLQRALAMLRAGQADALLVVKLDRLTRSLRDFEELLEYFTSGAQLLSCTEQVDTTTAGGRMVLRILMAVAQHERKATAERTSATARHQASRGQYTGGAARYGWRVGADGAQLEHVPEEQAVITKARELRASGLSLKAVGEA